LDLLFDLIEYIDAVFLEWQVLQGILGILLIIAVLGGIIWGVKWQASYEKKVFWVVVAIIAVAVAFIFGMPDFFVQRVLEAGSLSSFVRTDTTQTVVENMTINEYLNQVREYNNVILAFAGGLIALVTLFLTISRLEHSRKEERNQRFKDHTTIGP
jgi:uncharacterized membrane protein